MKFLRSVKGCTSPDKLTNKSIREDLNIFAIHNKTIERQLEITRRPNGRRFPFKNSNCIQTKTTGHGVGTGPKGLNRDENDNFCCHLKLL